MSGVWDLLTVLKFRVFLLINCLRSVWTAVTKHHTLDGLETEEFYRSQVWRLKNEIRETTWLGLAPLLGCRLLVICLMGVPGACFVHLWPHDLSTSHWHPLLTPSPLRVRILTYKLWRGTNIQTIALTISATRFCWILAHKYPIKNDIKYKMLNKSVGLFLSFITLENFRWNTIPKSGLPIVCLIILLYICWNRMQYKI